MKKFLPLALIATVLTVGCSTTWLTTFESYLKIAGPALISILELIGIAKGEVPSAALVAKINADQSSLNTLAASVSSATGQNVQGVCAQFNLAVQTFASDATAVESIAQVSNPTTQAQIQDAIQLFQVALSEVEAPIASCQAAASPAVSIAALAKAAVTVKSPAQYVSQFNAIMDRQTTDPKVAGKTKPLHIHYHSSLVRAVTFGLAK